MKRELARLLREAKARGWAVERTRRSHLRLSRHSVNGATVIAARNVAADLRHADRAATPAHATTQEDDP